MVSAWQSRWARAPRRTRSGPTCTWGAAPSSRTPTIQVGGCYLGSIGGAANLLNQLYAKNGSRSLRLLPQPVLLPERDAAGGRRCASIGYQAWHLPWQGPWRAAEPPAAVRQVRLLHQAAEQRQGSAPCCARSRACSGCRARKAGSAASRLTPSAARSTASRRPRPRSCTGTPSSGPSTPPTGPTARPRRASRRQHAWLRSFWTAMRAYATGHGLPELHRPGPDHLAPGLSAPTSRACSRSRRPTTPPASSPSPKLCYPTRSAYPTHLRAL